MVTGSRPEPEWSDVERDKMLALAHWEATELCPRCGGPKEVCQSPGARYATSPPIRCAYTDSVVQEQEAWNEAGRKRVQALIPQLTYDPTT